MILTIRLFQKYESWIMTELKKQIMDEFTIEEMKQFLKRDCPQMKQDINNFTEEEIKLRYGQLMVEEKQLINNSQAEDANSLFSVNKSENCKIQDDSIYKQKKSRNPRAKSEKNINKNSDMPSSSEIRQLLIKNLPEMQAEIKIINQEDLYDLYNFFRQSSQPQQKSKNPEKIEMMTAILKQVPSMKDKLCNCTEAQIKKIYDSLKQIRTHPSCAMLKKKGKKSQVGKNFNLPPKSSKKTSRYQQIQRQLQNSAHEKSEQMNQLNDFRYQGRYLQQQQEWNDKKYRKSHNLSKEHNFQQTFANNKYLGGTELEIPLLRKQKEKEKAKMWEMEHGEGQNVRARTYVMIHTQYEGQPRKRLKGQTSIGKCSCSCCKNNTFVNVFKQIIEQIESRKK